MPSNSSFGSLPLQVLLDARAPLEAADKSGDTPLHEALRRWQDDKAGQYMGAVRTLLDAGASTTAANKEGLTPLARAIAKGSPQLEQALRRAGGAGHSTAGGRGCNIRSLCFCTWHCRPEARNRFCPAGNILPCLGTAHEPAHLPRSPAACTPRRAGEARHEGGS